MKTYDISSALNEVLNIFNRSNKYIDETTPWILAKENNFERLDTVLYNLSQVILKGATLLLPFLTKQPKKIFTAFGVSEINDFKTILDFNVLQSGIKVNHIEALYKRLDLNKENEELWALNV